MLTIRFLCATSAASWTADDDDVISGDYCHAETFRASCDEDDDVDAAAISSSSADATGSIGNIDGGGDGQFQVIVIDVARYGRMELGRCVEVDVMGHLGCQTDVLGLVDRRCSGRRRCEIRVPDAELESTRPCLRELKTYLHVAYRCVPGEFSFDSRSQSGKTVSDR
jgi:hypothetical protein